MKHKKLSALALAAIMTLSALGATAAAASAGEDKTPAAQQTQEQSAPKEKKEGGHHAKGGDHKKKEKVAEPENAIGKQAAKDIAIADAGVTVNDSVKVRARVRTLEDGTVVYKVSFTVNGVYRAYKINATSGAIADKSEMSAEEHEAAKAQRKSHGKKSSDTTGSDQTSGKRHGKGRKDAPTGTENKDKPSGDEAQKNASDTTGA